MPELNQILVSLLKKLVENVLGYYRMENNHEFVQMCSNKHLMGDRLVGIDR